MKFDNEFKKQMVPEWADAYVDYNGLKRLLRGISCEKQTKRSRASSGHSKKKPTVDSKCSEVSQPRKCHIMKDIENQVEDSDKSQRHDLRQLSSSHRKSQEIAEIELTFFRKLDEELNKCARRLLEEKDEMHGYNALKYLPTIVAVIRTAFELRKGVTWMVLALISSAVAMLINTYWDIVVDWGLLQKHSKNKYLRDRLLVSNKRVYFAARLLNVLLRIAWIQLVLAFNLRSFQKVAATTSISCLEIIHRGLWNFSSLENEHLNNVNKYQSFKSVPLPFSYSDDDNDKDD